MTDKIIQVSGFGVKNTMYTQTDYMLVALTESGKVLMSRGDGEWESVGPKGPEDNRRLCPNCKGNLSFGMSEDNWLCIECGLTNRDQRRRING